MKRVREDTVTRPDDAAAVLGEALRRSVPVMPEAAKAAVRTRLVAAAAPSTAALRAHLFRTVAAVAAGVTLMGGVSYAAVASAPGDLLFPLKQSTAHVYESLRRELGFSAVPRTLGGETASMKPEPLKAPSNGGRVRGGTSGGGASGSPKGGTDGATAPAGAKSGGPAAGSAGAAGAAKAGGMTGGKTGGGASSGPSGPAKGAGKNGTRKSHSRGSSGKSHDDARPEARGRR